MTPWTVACQSPLSIEFWQEYWSGLPCSPLGDLPNPGIKPGSPALRADSLPSEPPGKPMNTGVGSLTLLQGIFPTQESNQGLLHCRQILYQLSHQGSHLGKGADYDCKGPMGYIGVEWRIRPLRMAVLLLSVRPLLDCLLLRLYPTHPTDLPMTLPWAPVSAHSQQRGLWEVHPSTGFPGN